MTPACPWQAGQDPVTAVEPFAQQIRVAIVPVVLLDHVDMHPPHAHIDIAVRMVEGLIQVLAAGRFPGKVNLPQVDGEVLHGIGGIEVIELPVRVSLAGVQEAGALARDAAAKPPRPTSARWRISPSGDRPWADIRRTGL